MNTGSRSRFGRPSEVAPTLVDRSLPQTPGILCFWAVNKTLEMEIVVFDVEWFCEVAVRSWLLVSLIVLGSSLIWTLAPTLGAVQQHSGHHPPVRSSRS